MSALGQKETFSGSSKQRELGHRTRFSGVLDIAVVMIPVGTGQNGNRKSEDGN
jgi:hypothetical protein